MTRRASTALPPPATPPGAGAAPLPGNAGPGEGAPPAPGEAEPAANSPADLGRVHAPPSRARAPREAEETPPSFEILEVKPAPPWGFEAVVKRPDGKTTGYLGPTALAAREKAERAIEAAGGAR